MGNVHIIDLNFLELEHSIAVFVVEGPHGRILIETGPYSTWPTLETALANHGWDAASFDAVLLSHIHFDHAGAAWAFAKRGVKIYVHPKGLPHLVSPEKLYNSARMIYGEAMDTLWGAMEPIREEQLYAPEHGEKIEVGGLTCTAWYTPGHAVHHIAWQVDFPDAEPVIFTGDVAGVRIDNGPVVPPCPPPDIQVEDWQKSIRLLRELPVETLFLTHYGKVTEKVPHLDALEARLLDWAEWMRPFAQQGIAPETIVPEFEAYVARQLSETGVSETVQKRYEAANPAFMSVAGLMRYWKKKN